MWGRVGAAKSYKVVVDLPREFVVEKSKKPACYSQHAGLEYIPDEEKRLQRN
jgi:hypothetical protein